MSYAVIIWSWAVHSDLLDINTDGSLTAHFLLLVIFKYAMLCHVDNFDSIKLVIIGLIRIWECALN